MCSRLPLEFHRKILTHSLKITTSLSLAEKVELSTGSSWNSRKCLFGGVKISLAIVHNTNTNDNTMENNKESEEDDVLFF